MGYITAGSRVGVCGQVIVKVSANVKLWVEVDTGNAELLFVYILDVLVPVPDADYVGLLGVVLDTVGGGEQVEPGHEDGPAPVE